MKVLVFAHTPPPHHGQSYMVQIMLENVGQPKSPAGEIVFYQLNARFSDGMDDIGAWRMGKVFLLIRYILQAWWLRWRYAPEAFYYVPAPAKRSALYRDWLVLLLVAPLFKVRVFHWHAIGLGQWVGEGTTQGAIRRWESGITRRLFSGNDLSLVLNEQGRRDVEIFSPRRIAVVPNGIPDPCPDFDSVLLPERLRRWRKQAGPGQEHPSRFELLYLAHATRTKGLFDAVEAVSLANARLLAEKSGVRIRLTVAGAFLSPQEERAFHERIHQDDLALAAEPRADRAVVYAGYAGPQEKDRLLRISDALCFASYFPNEAQPVSVIEPTGCRCSCRAGGGFPT